MHDGCIRLSNLIFTLMLMGVLWHGITPVYGSTTDPFTTILNHGPSSNRVDMIFLGDGYTANDLAAGVYDNHVDGYLNHMFSNTVNADPFSRYRQFFNIHRVDVVSGESGADVVPEGIFRDTALDARYYFDGTTERLLYISAFKANAVLNNALAEADFSAEMRYVTVNDTRYGGGGGSYAVFAGGNASASEIALHEMAHSFSDLADEYGGLANPYTGPELGEINVTTDPSGDKWERWLGYRQPGIGVIGAYEGGRYYNSGIYRPSQDSKMRSLGRPFDAIAREKIILDIYAVVDPLDDWLDNSSLLLDPDELYVQTVDDSVIDVQWFVDDQPIPAASGETFDLRDFGFGPGDYSVTARAFDPTGFDLVDGWVRMNQEELEQFVTWDVTLSEPLIGDANGDRFVTFADFLILQNHFGQPGGLQEGDFNGDGVISIADFSIIQNAFVYDGDLVEGDNLRLSIPEPSAVVMLALGAAMLFRRQ